MIPRTGFLSNASAGLINALEAAATEISLDPGEVLFRQDDPGDALFVVISGTLEISLVSAEGRTFMLDLLGPGALFGEIALFDPGPRTATVTANSKAVLRRLRHAELLRDIQETPDIGVDLLRLCGQRMRAMGSQLGDQVFQPMPARLARKILYLTDERADRPPNLTMSQAHIADYVGATREAVSKTLGEWKRMGVIQSSRKGIDILDRPALQQLADIDSL